MGGSVLGGDIHLAELRGERVDQPNVETGGRLKKTETDLQLSDEILRLSSDLDLRNEVAGYVSVRRFAERRKGRPVLARFLIHALIAPKLLNRLINRVVESSNRETAEPARENHQISVSLRRLDPRRVTSELT